MLDFNHDGKQDYKDFIMYEEFIENQNEKEEDLEIRNTSYQEKYWENRGGKGLSRGGAFIIRMIVGIVVLSIVEMISPILALIGLVIWAFFEFATL